MRTVLKYIAATLMSSLFILVAPFVSGDSLNDDISVVGFFSLDATYADSNSANLPRAGGRNAGLNKHEVDFDSSVAGLRGDVQFNHDFSASLQAISTRQTEGSYKPDIEWLYLKYDFGNEVSIRGGQLELPFLQGTELRYVGHSRLWVRPVVPNNGMGGFDTFRGAEIYHNSYIGHYDIQWNLSLGKPEHERGAINNSKVALVSAELEGDTSKVRLAFVKSDYDAWSGEEAYSDVLNMMSLEVESQHNNWVVNGGLVTDTDERFLDEYLVYSSLGYRIGQLTPYIFWSRSVMGFETLALFGQDEAIYSELSSDPGLQDVYIDGKRRVKTYSLGVRYDLSPVLALKLQWEKQKEKDIFFFNRPSSERASNIYTIVFEGVF